MLRLLLLVTFVDLGDYCNLETLILMNCMLNYHSTLILFFMMRELSIFLHFHPLIKRVNITSFLTLGITFVLEGPLKDTGTKEENILKINKEDNNANLQFIDVADVKKNEEFDLFIPVLKQGVKTVS